MATSFEQFGIIFDNIIKNLDANISTGIPGTDLWFKRNAIAQVASNITNDLDILSNNNIYLSSETDSVVTIVSVSTFTETDIVPTGL